MDGHETIVLSCIVCAHAVADLIEVHGRSFLSSFPVLGKGGIVKIHATWGLFWVCGEALPRRARQE